MSELTNYFLIDTNILIHAVDETSRTEVASIVVRGLTEAHRGAVTTQIVAEFFDATTRQRSGRIVFSREQASFAISALLNSAQCLGMSPPVFREAMRCAQRYQMRIYDAQIWAVASNSGIRFVLTEDMLSQPEIEGVRYVNPFTPAFRLEHIGL